MFQYYRNAWLIISEMHGLLWQRYVSHYYRDARFSITEIHVSLLQKCLVQYNTGEEFIITVNAQVIITEMRGSL